MTVTNRLPRMKGDGAHARIDHERFLRPEAAAEVVGLSPDALRDMRKRDRKALNTGQPTEGPAWHERWLGKRVMVSYRLSQLLAWADSFWTASGSSPPASSDGDVA